MDHRDDGEHGPASRVFGRFMSIAVKPHCPDCWVVLEGFFAIASLISVSISCDTTGIFLSNLYRSEGQGKGAWTSLSQHSDLKVAFMYWSEMPPLRSRHTCFGGLRLRHWLISGTVRGRLPLSPVTYR